MNLNDVIEAYADKVDGKHSSYDDTKSVVIVPVTAHRFQSVIASLCKADDLEYIEVSSKICAAADIPPKLWHLQAELVFGKLIVRDDYLQAAAYIDDAMGADLVAGIINEVASFSDKQEQIISGKDKY